MTTPVGEVLISDYSVHELPSDMATCTYTNEPSTSQGQSCDLSSIVVNKALLARIEFLESELAMCRSKLSSQQSHFHIADIARTTLL